jgi:hypothetical protein
VEIKGRRSEVHHHTTQIKQNGEETKESTVIHVHFSGHECTFIKQEINGEESYSLDFKR